MPSLTRPADITAGRCGAPVAARWCIRPAGHPLGRGRGHRATPQSDRERAIAHAFARKAGIPDDPPGGDAALCTQVDPELFFPDAGSQEERQAKQICLLCDLRPDCLLWALTRAEPLYGVWGGTSKTDRRAIFRRRPEPPNRTPGDSGPPVMAGPQHEPAGAGAGPAARDVPEMTAPQLAVA